MGVITREEIWRRAKLQRVKVEGAPCLEDVYVRGMMLDEFTEWDAWCEANDQKAIARRIVLDFCVDADGKQLFQEADAEKIGTLLPAEAFTAAAMAFARVNKAAQQEAENAAKNGKRHRKTSSSRSRKS